jgi:hypothetical protein
VQQWLFGPEEPSEGVSLVEGEYPRLPVAKQSPSILDDGDMLSGESPLSPDNPIWNFYYWNASQQAHPLAERAVDSQPPKTFHVDEAASYMSRQDGSLSPIPEEDEAGSDDKYSPVVDEMYREYMSEV